MALLPRTYKPVKDLQINIRRHISIACYLLVGTYFVLALYLLSGLLSGPGRFYRSGVPAGSDFLRVWAASSLASQDRPALVYDVDALRQVEIGVVGVPFSYNVNWHYPPSFLWLMLPLSALNYFAALALWLFLPLGALLALLYGIYPDRLTIWLALASIATAQNLFYAQGAFMIAFLMGSGLLWLDRRPLLSGALFSLLVNYKPHLGLLLFVALGAGRRWRALGALLVTSATLFMVSAWALGPDTWLAFCHDMLRARLEMGAAILWDRMPTVFAATRLLGGSERLAMTLQSLTSLGAAAGVYWTWRDGRYSLPVRGAVLALATLLVTPYAFNYDLTLLLLLLAFLAREALDNHWGQPIGFVLVLVWLIPFLDFISAQLARIHLVPLLLAALLIYLLTRPTAAGANRPIPTG